MSASDVWAVGEFSKPGVGFQTLIEQWNGHKWGVVPSPDVGSLDELTAVTAVSASDVWAVGFSEANPSTFPFPQTLILHWDGTSWSIVPSPNPGPLDSRLSGVTAVTSTVIEQWDGTSWSVVPSPDPSTAENILAAAAADPASGQAWAVGEFFDNATSTRQTLTEFNPWTHGMARPAGSRPGLPQRPETAMPCGRRCRPGTGGADQLASQDDRPDSRSCVASPGGVTPA